MMNTLKVLISQWGNWSQRQESKAMLLEPSELPGDGWKVSGGRSWRPGFDDYRDERSQRARLTGEYISLRYFEQPKNLRWLWTQVLPFASEEDAIDALPHLPGRMNRNSERAFAESKIIGDLRVADVAHSIVFEESSTGLAGPGVGKYVCGNVNHIVFVVGCAMLGDEWPWSDVIVLAELQARKVESCLYQAI